MFLACIVLCVCMQGYDISFLITNFHTEQMFKHKLVDFVIQVRGRGTTLDLYEGHVMSVNH